MAANEEKKTILHFIFVHDDKAMLNQYFREIYLPKSKFSFCLGDNKGSIDEWDSDIEETINKIDIDSSKSNDIKYNVELDENNFYYHEKIRLYPTADYKISNISLEYQIYKDKINSIYFDELNDQKKSNISLEIIYYSRNENLLPKKIIYKNKELTCFDSYQNKSRRRIAFLNVDPEQFDFIEDIKRNYPDFKFINNFSYQILVRIANNGEKNYTISKNELKDIGLKKKLKEKKNKSQMVESLKEFKTQFNESFLETQLDTIDDIENKITELSKKYETSLEIKKYYDNMFDYSAFNSDDIEIFILMFYLYEFLAIKDMCLNKDKKLDIIDTLDSLSNYNNDYEKYIPKLKELDIDIRDKLLLIKAYNKKFFDSFRSGYKIDYITVINISKEEKINPYVKALDFIKNIITDLKEESRLFEAFINLDSDTITNLLINLQSTKEEYTGLYGDKIIIERGKNPTEYGINMMNIDEVRDHLLSLIPKYIIRIDTRMKFKADFDPNSKIMTLNERELFNYPSLGLNKTFKRKNFSDKYILPISIEILHEIFGHGKKRLIDNKEKSPEEYRDSKNDFKRISVTKKVSDFKEIIHPESGVVLENFISENRNVIRWLKATHNPEYTKEILKTSLWVDKDFNNLEKIVGNYIADDKRYETNESKYSLYFNDNDLIDMAEDDGCGFQLYEHKY